jgi:hypothetical protein
MYIQEALGVTLILVGCASPVLIVGVIYYLKKRLDHRQVLAAIEKGAPLAQLAFPKPAGPAWIKHLSLGIALLVVAFGVIISHRTGMFVAFILAGVGAAWLVRGLLYRHYYLKGEGSNENSGESAVSV